MEQTSGLVHSEKIGKVKLRRESKPKSRNGCSTCKTRRVKCDESKPICNRCIAFDMKEDCVYIQKRESGPPLRPLAPRDATLQRAKVPIMKISTLNTALPGNDAERRYFKFFKDALALDFCGWFETPFWTHFMPQQCHYEPTIRHSILALSAIYLFRASRIAGTSESDLHLKFALVQQNKAISSLKKHMALETPQTRLILIACLLFACVESFHDDLNTTTRQFSSGLAILKYWKKEENRKREEGLAVFDDDVRNAIARFELQIKSYLILSPLSGDVSLDYEDEEPPKLPNRFVETGQAFMHASRLSNDFLRYLRTSPRYVKDEIDVALCQPEHRKMKEQIDEWKTRYVELFQTVQTNQNIDPRTYLASIHLVTCLRTFEIMFSTCLTKNETIFDDFTQQFTKIVSWCRFSVEKDREMRRSAGLGDSLRAQFGMGTIMPLYYTATRCRHLSVRNDAIAILKGFPSKNGMWDSLMTARVAEWVVEREEKEEVDGVIPEEGRVRASTLKMDLRKGAIYVECLQGQTFVMETIIWEQ